MQSSAFSSFFRAVVLVLLLLCCVMLLMTRRAISDLSTRVAVIEVEHKAEHDKEAAADAAMGDTADVRETTPVAASSTNTIALPMFPAQLSVPSDWTSKKNGDEFLVQTPAGAPNMVDARFSVMQIGDADFARWSDTNIALTPEKISKEIAVASRVVGLPAVSTADILVKGPDMVKINGQLFFTQMVRYTKAMSMSTDLVSQPHTVFLAAVRRGGDVLVIKTVVNSVSMPALETWQQVFATLVLTK